MSTNRWVEARVRDPTYMEVGGGGGREGSTIQLKEKEAYRLNALQLKQIYLTLFAFTAIWSARILEGVNAKSLRLTPAANRHIHSKT